MSGEKITCWSCDGHGVRMNSNPYDPSVEECSTCAGNGHVWKYSSGALAKWLGGPMVGRLTKKEMSE